MAEMSEVAETMIDAFADDEPEADAEVVEVAADATGEPESADEAPSAPEVGAEPAPPADTDQPSNEQIEAYKAALIDERRRRQEAEAAARLREEQIAELAAPDPDEEPEEYAKWVQEKSARANVTTKFDLSRDLMAEAHPDFEEQEQVFMSLVRNEQGQITNPVLVAQMMDARNPAKFAYEYAKNHQAAEQYANPEKRAALEAQMEERIRSKVLAELQAAGVVPKSPARVDVPDLTSAAGAGSNLTELEAPVTLASVFDD
jgi:hypothetical protein